MSQLNSNLVWSPIGPKLMELFCAEGGIRLLIAPFIQRDALANLLEHLSSHADLKIVTRWTAKDIAAGASDPYVYEECAARRIPLFLHPTIHLKLFTMASGRCFCGSANITSSGLGLHGGGNIEAGVWSSVAVGDWRHVYEIINRSRIADEVAFKTAVDYRNKFLHSVPPLPPLDLPACPSRDFTLASLPATLDPETVAAFGASGSAVEDVSDINCIMHDLVEFGGESMTDARAIIAIMGERFLTNPFVKQIIDHVRESSSLCFGEVTAWIHAHCRDVPVPYRWEVKQATRVLYNWLSYYVSEISWSVPGQHSQVIRWSPTLHRKAGQGWSDDQ